MVTVEDCECVSRLLGNTISMLCKNALKFHKELRIEGILGITVDRDMIFLVRVNEAFSKSDHEHEVRVESAPAASVNSPRLCRPPVARRLALMPPEMTSIADSNSPKLQGSSRVLAWPLETTASPNARQVPVARPAMPTQPARSQVIARGRGAIRSRHMAVTGPRFPLGRPRLNVPGNNRNVASLRGLKPAIRASRQRMPAPSRLPGTVTPRKVLSIESAQGMQQSVGQIVRAAFSPRGSPGQPPRKFLAIESPSTNFQSPRNPVSKAVSTLCVQRTPRGQGPQGQIISIQLSPRSKGPQGQISIQQSPRGQGPQGQMMSIQQSSRGQGPQSQIMSIQQSPRGQRLQGQISIQQSPRGPGPQSQIMSTQQSPRGQGPQGQISIQQSPRGQEHQGQISIKQSPRGQGPQGQIISIQQSPRSKGPQGQISIQQSPRGQGPQGQMMSIQQSSRGQGPQSQIMSIQQSPRGQGLQGQISIQQSPRGQGPQSQIMSTQQSPRGQGPQGQISIQQSPRGQGPQGQISTHQSPRGQGSQSLIMSTQQSLRGQGPQGQMSIQQCPRGQGLQGQPSQSLSGQRLQAQMSNKQSVQEHQHQIAKQSSLIHHSPCGQGPKVQMTQQQSPGAKILTVEQLHAIQLGQKSQAQGLSQPSTNLQSSSGHGPQTLMANQLLALQQSPAGHGPQTLMANQLLAFQQSPAGHGPQNQMANQLLAIQRSPAGHRPQNQMANQLLAIQQSSAGHRPQNQMANQLLAIQQSSAGHGPQNQMANQLLAIQQSPTGPRPEAQFAQQWLSTQQSLRLHGLQGHTAQQHLSPVVHTRPALHAPSSPIVQRFDVSLANQVLSAQQSLRGQQLVTNSFGQMQIVNPPNFIQQPSPLTSPSVFHPSIPGMSPSNRSVASCLADARLSSPVVYAVSTGVTMPGVPSDVSSSINVNQIILGAQGLYASVQPAQTWLPAPTVDGQFTRPQQFQQQQSSASPVPVLIQASQRQNTSGGQQNLFVPPSQSQFHALQGRLQPVQIEHPQCSQNQSQIMSSPRSELQHVAEPSDHSDWLNKFIDEQLNKIRLIKQDGQQGASTEERTSLSQQQGQQAPFQQLVESSCRSPIVSHKISDKQNILPTTCIVSPQSSALASSSPSCAALSGSSSSTTLVSAVCVAPSSSSVTSSSVTVSSERAATKARKASRSSASAISLSASSGTRSSTAVAASRSKKVVKTKKKTKPSASVVRGTPSSTTIAVSRSRMPTKSGQVAKSKSADRDASKGSCIRGQPSRALSCSPRNSLSHQSFQSPNRVSISDNESQSSNTTIVSTSWCDLELGCVGAGNVSLHLSQTESSDDQLLLKCKARGCKAHFSTPELLATHYASNHMCDWGPPKDVFGQQLYNEWKSRDATYGAILFNSSGKAVCRICNGQYISEASWRSHMSKMHGMKSSRGRRRN